MDLLDWIAASRRVKFVSDRNEAVVRAQLQCFHPRGFITDFIHAPMVAKERGRKILVSRTSSFWGRFGLRCVAYIRPVSSGCQIDARVWHAPLFTAWLCLNYGMSMVLLLGSMIAAFQSSSGGQGIAAFVAGSLMGSFWIGVTGVCNAVARVHRKPAIDELMTLLSSVANAEPAPEPNRDERSLSSSKK